LKAKDLFRQNDAVVETIVFLDYFSICVVSVTRLLRPVSFVSMVASQRYQGAMLRNQRSDLPALVVVSLGSRGYPQRGNPTMLGIGERTRMCGHCRYRETLSRSMTCRNHPSRLWPF
jgi:hypothetical protein